MLITVIIKPKMMRFVSLVAIVMCMGMGLVVAIVPVAGPECPVDGTQPDVPCDSLDNCFESCCLTSAVCPTASCVTNFAAPNNQGANCNQNSCPNSECDPVVMGCTANNCLGTLDCTPNTNCDGGSQGDLCFYDGGSPHNYKICESQLLCTPTTTIGDCNCDTLSREICTTYSPAAAFCPQPSCITQGCGCLPVIGGDPQFNGLQGQYFQFHGMADEVFSLVSSPNLQINSLFKFISSGVCDYNDTVCWSHPGTYLGQIGIQYGNNKILLQSGSHSEGMKIYINDNEILPSYRIHELPYTNNNTNNNHHKTASISALEFKSRSIFSFRNNDYLLSIINSDYFFNMNFAIVDRQILNAGSRLLTFTGEICERESQLHNKLLAADSQHQHTTIIKAKLLATYPSYPLHGLIGQTWRNVEYCGKYFEGSVDDYVTGDLFGNIHTFNYFQA
jgi:hypothetical protein